MKRYAILLGSAPEDFRQKKIEDMFDFLDSKRSAGDSIVTFANGISEMMLEMVMGNSIKQLTNAVVEPVETTTHSELHSETQICRSATQNCHSEFISESTNARHSEAKPKNLFLQEMFRSAQHDIDNEMFRVAQYDGDKTVVSSASTTTNNKMNSILLYICTLQPVRDGEKSIWLGGEEVRRDVILHYQKLAAECGIDMQVIFDSDSEMISEEKLGYEKVVSTSSTAAEFGGAR